MSQRRTPTARRADPYARLRRIDGRHPLKRRAPRAHVAYRARRRPGAEVVWFNFDLAREMGLIARSHPDHLDTALARAIVSAFSLQIVNEYDEQHGRAARTRDELPHRFMATRYLQLQHPGRQGRTSGDGRSVWNGCVTHNGVTWDISSCGTGVTRLCPATAKTGRFYRTGSRVASYGCGTAGLDEGLGSALMSETLHRNGIATERVLAVLRLPSGLAINVRAAPNLLRPSHFFAPLKQGDLDSLRGIADCFIERQVANGAWPRPRSRAHGYRMLAERAAITFGHMAATFEREYLFCWLDWDGDNILADGGVIDYGSVRQFGLFHREYRFDDVDRMSTSILEQRRKARAIVASFAQARDFLLTGTRPPLRNLARDPVLRRFDRAFADERDRRLLWHMGFDARECALLQRHEPDLVRAFDRAHAHFERARSKRGPRDASDGITWDAIFSTRDLLRELPEHFAMSEHSTTSEHSASSGPASSVESSVESSVASSRPAALLSPEAFLEIAASSYARPSDRRASAWRRRQTRTFQRAYLAVTTACARRTRRSRRTLLTRMARRAATINRPDRITGDSIDYATHRLLKHRHRLGPDKLHAVLRGFVDNQDLDPGHPARPSRPGRPGPADHADRTHPDQTNPSARARRTATHRRTPKAADTRRVIDALLRLVHEFRHGL